MKNADGPKTEITNALYLNIYKAKLLFSSEEISITGLQTDISRMNLYT